MSVFANVSDADNATKPGQYQSSNWENTPQASGILIIPFFAAGFWRFQLFCDNNSNHLWFRSGTSAAYGAWKQIT